MFLKQKIAQHFGIKLIIITSLHLCIIQLKLCLLIQFLIKSFLMSINQHQTNCIPQSCMLSATKKKYSKVNESLKQRFLSLIIQHNMSIKDASQTLNINYSSAKAILSSHRKSINVARKNCKEGLQAAFRTLDQTEDSFSKFSVICSTGGRETSRFGNIGKVKQIHKAMINPVIILRMEKQVQSLQHTSHSVFN